MAITIKESQHLSIPFEDIEVATNNFTTVIGKGGYGFVYKGKLLLSNKLTIVAVKRLSSNISGQGFKEFLTEIKLLSRYKHPNLISLLGFCEEGNEKILIYEHAVRGSLDKYLRSDDKAPASPLTWTQRINICIDAAQGLDYLHNHVGKFHKIIHRDIKSANILLDQSWKAMISDLGLSKIGRSNDNDSYLITNACGTHGYCDPVYRDTGILTKESDVYSFGVVLFEVLCGRLCFMNVQNERRFLDRLAPRYYEAGRLNEIVDIELKDQIGSTSLNIIADIAYQCLQNDREKRPSMSVVVEKLEEARKSQVSLIKEDFD
uniref:putative receptor-like protein kinase At5g39000 n=1 Tax=Erigeron canadensis TaxID=72917 RepID=UPI001CB8D4F9|nr:putative receptor-like protein kinase At5g39000 [Erigeron canadensis]